MTPDFQLDHAAPTIAAHLVKRGVGFRAAANGRLHVPLPNNFGTLEIGATGDGTDDLICGLVDHPWHTHGNQFEVTGINEQCAALAAFVFAIFDGKYLLIDEVWPDRSQHKRIEDDLARYLKDLPEGTTYRIVNR